MLSANIPTSPQTVFTLVSHVLTARAACHSFQTDPRIPQTETEKATDEGRNLRTFLKSVAVCQLFSRDSVV